MKKEPKYRQTDNYDQTGMLIYRHLKRNKYDEDALFEIMDQYPRIDFCPATTIKGISKVMRDHFGSPIHPGLISQKLKGKCQWKVQELIMISAIVWIPMDEWIATESKKMGQK